jgi:hypothetical protein
MYNYANMVTYSELQATTSVKFPYPPCLPGIEPPGDAKKDWSTMWAVHSWWAHHHYKPPSRWKGCGPGMRKQEGVSKSTSILSMNIRSNFYAYLNVSVIMADFQIGRTLKYCTYSNIGL